MKMNKRGLFVALPVMLVSLLLSLLLIIGLTQVQAQEDTDPYVSVNKTVSVNSSAECEELFDVSLTINGTRPDFPADVMIIFDRSGSMDDGGYGCTDPQYDTSWTCAQGGGVWGPQPITSAKEAAKFFIDQLDDTEGGDRVGLVSYSSDATLNNGLTFNHAAVKTSIDGLSAATYTNIAEAIYDATQELITNGREGAVKILIVMSDGVANRAHVACDDCGTYPCASTCCTQDAINQAQAAKDQGYVVFSVFLKNISDKDDGCTEEEVEQLGEDTMKAIASGPAYYYSPLTPEALGDIYDYIASQILPAATALTLTDVVAPQFAIVEGSLSPAPDSVVDNTIVWSWDILGAETMTFTYQIERASMLTPPGTYPTNPSAALNYTDWEGNPGSLDFPDPTATLSGVCYPTVTLDKTADPLTRPEPGGVFTFTLNITNTSVGPVEIVSLTDTQSGDTDFSNCLSLIGTTIPAGGWTSCTYTVTHTDAGDYQNTAYVTVEDNEGNQASDSDDATVTVTNIDPTVTLDKTADPLTRPEPGGVFTFTLNITNTSVEPVEIVSLTDTQSGDTDFSNCLSLIGTTIPAGGWTSCTYTVTHTDAGDYQNTAYVTVEDNEGNQASDSDDATVTVTNIDPTVTLDKTADPLTRPEPGGVFTFTLNITNTSVEPVEIVSLTDTQSGDTDFSNCLSLIGTTIPAGGWTSCTYTVTHTDAGDYQNTAYVTVEDNEGNQASDSDDATVTVTNIDPTVTLDKTADPLTRPEPGGVFTFTLNITNTSVEPVEIVSLTDTQSGDTDFSNCLSLIGTTIPAGGWTSCTYTVTHTDAGDYQNTAYVTVEDNEGNQASDSDDATVTVTNIDPTVTLDKTADPLTRPEPGGVFTFTLNITNTSVEPVEIVSLTDTQSGDTDFSNCLSLIGTTIPAGGWTSCTYTVTHTDAGDYQNTAYVTVEDNEGNQASDSDDATVTVTNIDPTVTLDKTADPLTRPEPGGVFTFTLNITNTSVEPVEIVSLTDTQSGDTDFSNCLSLIGTTIPAGGWTSCTYTVTHTDAGDYQNTAYVTVEDNEGNQASDSDDATVTVTNIDPTVTLDKTADPLTRPEPGGVFTFTLNITNTSVEPVEIVSLTDTQSGDTDFSNCLSLIGTTIPAGGWTSCTYTVTHTDAGDYQNTAYVTVEDNEGNQASDSDDATVTVTNIDPTVTLDKTADPLTRPEPGGVFTFTLNITNTSVEPVEIVSLTDTQSGDTDFSNCLSLIGTTIPAGGWTSCTYTVTHTDAGDYQNTAYVTVEDNEGNQASDSDDATVTVTNIDPTVTLDKTADPLTRPEPGGVFTFTLNITNTSVEPVEIVSLTDTQSGDTDFSNCLSLIGTTIPAGGWTSCTYTVTHTDAGDYQNTAYVTVEDNEGNQASDSDDATVTVTNIDPTVTLDKTADPLTRPEPGGVFTFTLNITNTSVEPVEIVSLTDTQSGDTDFSNCLSLIGTTIPAGGWTSCTYTVTHTDAGDYQNTAYVTVEDNEGNQASDSDDATVTVTNIDPTVTLDKTADPLTRPEPGGVFTFTLNITNTSVEPVEIVSLTDTQSGDTDFSNCLSLIGTTIPAGGWTSCTYTVTHTDAGDYQNTAYVTVEDNEGNQASDSDDATVTVTNIDPTVTLDKTADPLTRPEPGGVFTFTLNITNTSVEPVEIVSLTDTQSGDTDFSNCLSLIGTTIPAGGWTSCTYTVTHTDAGDYQNTAYVTVEDNEGNQASDSDDATVTVTNIDPTVTLDKTADPLTRPEPGGVFTFTLNITNTSVEPVEIVSLTDTQSGDTDFSNCLSLIGTTIPAGGWTSCTYTVTHTDAGDYQNTAYVTVEDNEGNQASDSDDATVTVTNIDPTVTLDKTADPLTRPEPGGVFTFTLNITNTSVEPVEIVSLTDTQSGDTDFSNCLSLIGTTIPAGGWTSCTYTVTHTDAGDYQNTAYVTVEDNEGNQASDSDDATVTVVATDYTVTKECSDEPVPQEGPAVFDVVFENTGDVELVVTADDGIGTFTLAVGETKTFQVSITGPFSGQTTVDNTINATASLPDYPGISSTYDRSDTASCGVGGRVNLLKLTNGEVKPSQTWTFNLYLGPDGFGGQVLATSNTSGDPDGWLDFDNYNLDPALTYTICEAGVNAGWASFWRIDTNGDGGADTTVIPYNPNADDSTPEDLGNRCFDFGAGTSYPITPGGTLVFEVDNTYPGGEPRTPGYWKNWNRCTSGGQQNTADQNGGWQEGFWLLEDVLDPNIGGGISWDDILDDTIIFTIVSCTDAVAILDQRDVNSGKKMSSDAAYTLAMHLLAAQLNFAAGAESCADALHAALQAEMLLDKYNFVGSGNYLRPKGPTKADYYYALDLADLLDQYNNGQLCSNGSTDQSPIVIITDPVDGSTVQDNITINATAADDNGVTQVEFFVDGTSIGVDSDDSDGWSATWDTTTVNDGVYAITATATDTDGQTASDGIAVTVDNVEEVPMHVEDLSDTTSINRNKWEASVTVTIWDENDSPLLDAVVSLMWDDGNVATCTTNSSGQCMITRTNINAKVESLTLEVTDVTKSGYSYDPDDNKVTVILVSKP